MARKTDASKKGRFNDVQFVQYELTKAERDHCKTWCTTLEEFDTAFLNIIDAGYRVSAKYDDYSKAYSAFVQTFDQADAHFNCILTGRGSTPTKAIKQALYKHFVVFDREWGSWLERREPSIIDD